MGLEKMELGSFQIFQDLNVFLGVFEFLQWKGDFVMYSFGMVSFQSIVAFCLLGWCTV